MNEMTEGHIVQRYNEEMGRLHDLVLKIADLVREQLRNAVRTMEEEDSEAAQQVIERDKEVNDLDVEADDEIIQLIAKRQPVAKDLREILTVGKIVTDLERVGDEARKIARLTIHFYDNDMPAPNNQIVLDIIKMARFVDVMLDKAIRSYNELDLDLAVKVIQMDLEIERDFSSSLRHLSTFILEDSRSIGHVVETVLGLRALERIGGHAKNIAGYVVFLVKGIDVRHEDLATVAAEVEARS
jgi:phosphate transport system protein